MKKSIFVIFTVIWIILLVSEKARAECSGSVSVTTPQSYADADTIECIDGNLTVAQNYGIINLIFHNLKSVSGNIYVVGRHPPSDWQLAFIKLETVGMGVYIGSNWHLTNIQMGANIDSVGGDFEFWNNDDIGSLRLGTLNHILGDLIVYENASIWRILGNYLESVGGLLEITDNASYCQTDAEERGYSIDADEYLIEDNEVCE